LVISSIFRTGSSFLKNITRELISLRSRTAYHGDIKEIIEARRLLRPLISVKEDDKAKSDSESQQVLSMRKIRL